MPTNKNAQLRYQILDRCFSDFNRKYEIQDLVDKVNDALYAFTREFYKYTPLKPSAEIFQQLKELEQQESELMEKLLH